MNLKAAFQTLLETPLALGIATVVQGVTTLQLKLAAEEAPSLEEAVE